MNYSLGYTIKQSALFYGIVVRHDQRMQVARKTLLDPSALANQQCFAPSKCYFRQVIQLKEEISVVPLELVLSLIEKLTDGAFIIVIIIIDGEI